MLPFISQESKRNINLGGTTSKSSHATILSHARALRNSRRDERLKEDAAIKIQRWLKAQRQAQTLRASLKAQFDLGPRDELPGGDVDEDLRYVNWTRLLVLGGADEERLARWSTEITNGDGTLPLLRLFGGASKESWLVLIKQMSLLLLKNVSQNSESERAVVHLHVLTTLLNPSRWEHISYKFASAPLFILSSLKEITAYLLQRNMLWYLARAFEQVQPSVKAKTQASLHLSQLLTAPFIIFNEDPSSRRVVTQNSPHTLVFLQFLTHVLTVSLLPNRIPLTELPKFVSRIPWEDLPLIFSAPHFSTIFTLPTTLEDVVLGIERSCRPHLLANLLAFLPPRYSKLTTRALTTYLELYTVLLDGLGPGELEPQGKFVSSSALPLVPNRSAEDDNSDSDEDLSMEVDRLGPSSISLAKGLTTRPQVTLAEVITPLDSRTLSRLATLATSSHLSSLLVMTSRHPELRNRLFGFVLSLTVALPNQRDHIWTTISVGQGGGSGLIRECWHSYVRSSPLGKIEDGRAVKILMDPVNASAWPAVLFLVSLYTHSLLTIGDDEFFSLSASATPRNPLTLDDLVAFSRQLLNIAFPLYWSEDQAKVKESGPAGIRFTWEKVRELVSGCLKGIHARDSRRSFTPPAHWLITSQVDLHSFVEAAVTEEQALSSSDSEVGSASQVRHRRVGLSPRQLAQLSPRLGVLNNIPFAIPFEVRVETFRQFIRNDFARTFDIGGGAGLASFRSGFDRLRRKRVTVRRDRIAQDGFDQLSSLGSDLKGSVEIQFVDQFGQDEAGIDGGGVFKEFLTSLSKEVFDTNRGLWLSTGLQELYPNPHSYATEPHQLSWYRFIGRILGKALYEGILVDVAFASFFLSKWLGKQSYLDDLASLDPELYSGLIFLKHYDKNFEDLSLNFTISEEDLGVARTMNLIPNGDQISVTRENRLQYIYLVSHYRLSRQIKRQSEAFFEGLSDIIDPKWLRMFNQQEVQILVGGVNAPIDLDDLRQNCNYGGLYDDTEETIQMFWKVVNSFDLHQRQALLRFVTSCGRPPLLGFKELYPKFCIRDSSSDEQRLPTSSTCVNLLKLPRYKSEKVMRDKLLQAITSGAGFDLS